MKKKENYLAELENFYNEIVDVNIPKSDDNLTNGTISNSLSFFKDYSAKLEYISDEVINKANSIMQELEENAGIEKDELKEELTSKCNELISNFIFKANSSFKE